MLGLLPYRIVILITGPRTVEILPSFGARWHTGFYGIFLVRNGRNPVGFNVRDIPHKFERLGRQHCDSGQLVWFLDYLILIQLPYAMDFSRNILHICKCMWFDCYLRSEIGPGDQRTDVRRNSGIHEFIYKRRMSYLYNKFIAQISVMKMQ
nr:Sugar transporter ERD6-like 5 [Ipomoea batatas]